VETLEILQRRIAISRGLQSIVRTMKTLSAVTIRRCEHASQSVKSFDETVDLGLQVVLRDPTFAGMAIRASEKAAVRGSIGIITVGSDHGLCGRYNNVVAEAALKEIESCLPEQVTLAAVGARTADLLGGADQLPSVIFATPGSVTGISETTGAILSLIDDWHHDQGIERVRIVHNVQTSENRARPVAMSLLPISPAYLRHQAERPWPSRRLPIYREERDTMLQRLLRQHVFVRVFRAIAEAQVSEHASRLSSMQAAERSIREHLSEMDAEYRMRRQEKITTELLDVVAGATVLGVGR